MSQIQNSGFNKNSNEKFSIIIFLCRQVFDRRKLKKQNRFFKIHLFTGANDGN